MNDPPPSESLPVASPPAGRRAGLTAGVAAVATPIVIATAWRGLDPVVHLPDVDAPSLVGVRGVLDALLGLWGVAVLLAMVGSLPNGRRAVVGVLAPLLVHLVPLHLLKWAVGRARPRLDLGPNVLRPFEGLKDFDSFPSGHAAATLLVAILLGLYFPRYRWVFYVAAVLVGVERVINRWHYPSDVLAGYALGAATAWVFYRGLGPAWYRPDLSAPSR